MPAKRFNNNDFLSSPVNMRANLDRLNPGQSWQFFADFNELAIVEADSPWIFHNGSDATAIDTAINVQERGVIRLSAGDGDGTVAVDGSQMVLQVPVQADSGGLAFECSINMTDITKQSVFVGFTDISTLEEPFSVSGTTVTSVATDACGFIFDTAMTTDAWFAVGVDTNVDATGQGTTAIVPVNNVDNILRMEIDSTGTTASAFIDGVLVKSLTANVCDGSTNLFFTCIAVGDGANTAVAIVDVDYCWVEHDR